MILIFPKRPANWWNATTTMTMTMTMGCPHMHHFWMPNFRKMGRQSPLSATMRCVRHVHRWTRESETNHYATGARGVDGTTNGVADLCDARRRIGTIRWVLVISSRYTLLMFEQVSGRIAHSLLSYHASGRRQGRIANILEGNMCRVPMCKKS
jgi:hypothetical protein